MSTITEQYYIGSVLKYEADTTLCRKKYPVLAGQALEPGDICVNDGSGNKKQIVSGTHDAYTLTEVDGTDGGTFRIVYKGQITSALAWNVSAANTQTALRALHPDLAAVTVALASQVYTITGGAIGNDGLTVVNDLTADGGVDEGGITVERGLLPDSICLEKKTCTNEVQTIVFSGTATGGTYTLTFTKNDSTQVTTGAIAYDATAAEVTTACNAVLGTDACAVTGTNADADGTLTIAFDGANYQGFPQDLVAITDSLTGGTPVQTIARSTTGADGEALFLDRGPAVVDYGRLDYNSCTVATADAALLDRGIRVVTGATQTTLNS